MGQFLYLLLIYPLYQIIEFCYTLSDGIVKNPGMAIIGVSLAVSFLCLPLYIIAENWQEKERQAQAKMKPGIDRIKAVFKGDEQYMILSTFYRQNHYHPMMALRSSISLLIQIPFFIAAYQFLSHLEALTGTSFLFIKDLGQQDALFHIGSFPVNILPIAMTIINIIAGAIYTKGHALKEKLQIYLMALFFLVFLYTSPSGLVFYWTLNNVFSLVKNVFYKLKKPLRALYFCLVAGVLLVDWYLIFEHGGFLYRRLTLVGALCIVPLSPLIIKGIKYLLNNQLKAFSENDRQRDIVFYTSAIALAIMMGFAIPSYIISSSPTEFSFVDNYDSPFFFLRYTLFQCIGLFVVWPTALYLLFNKKIKTIFAILMSTLCLCGIVNAFAFGGDYGTISTILTFTNAGEIIPTKSIALLNLLACAAVFAFIIILTFINRTKILSFISSVIIIASIGISIVNSVPINKGYKEAIMLKKKDSNISSLTPVFHLSKTEKNVIVFMQDRAINGFFPYMLEEKPELKEQYEGFTYFPNTVSYGGMTLNGVPPVYGGYEYTPEEMNRQEDRPLVEKHNEACKMMPVLFSQNGFKSTVTDMSWANYMWIPDLRIFDDYPEIQKAPLIRQYADYWIKNHPGIKGITSQSTYLKRNFLWFSVFKIMPQILRETIYDEGHWWTAKTGDEYLQDFLNNYAALDYYPELTDFTSDQPTFTIIVNEATHEPAYTGYPNYDFTSNDVGPGPLDDDKHYQANSAAIYRIGDFLDYLKENDAYDNTRIIIVADHGGGTKLDKLDEDYDHHSPFIPLLLYKDFDSRGEIITDNTFMTNADTPSLATKDLIENPVNPFTGKAFKDTIQKDKVFVMIDGFWSPDGHHKNTFKAEGWESVHDNVYDKDCWAHEIPEGLKEEK